MKLLKLREIKHIYVLLFLSILFSTTLFSQTKNFPSLLWKISGNGLQQPSYLYGTMHVSKKVAFHLTDAFFEGLKSAEVVALESNPETWLEELMGESATAIKNNSYKKYLPNNYNQNFYEDAFSFFVPTDKTIQFQISKEPENVNGLLYRFSGYSGNFEEETYLDLFIMQAAKKAGKSIASLEDYKTSMEMVRKASLPDDEKVKDKATKKYYLTYEIWDQIENAYRKGDLDAMDSLQRLTYTKNFEKYMLIERNKIMAHNMDSLMKKHILFTAIGAAHLPGNEGVINMLRAMGYTVEAVKSDVTKSSIKQMDKYGDMHTALNFKTKFLADSTIQVDAPGQMYEMNSRGLMYECLYTDMVNGSYYDMRRIKVYGTLLEQNAKFQLDRIDKLLYESIPGKIISKKNIKANDGSLGFDILNKTNRGDFQRYNIFATDEFIYIFKVSGTGDYVKSSEFDNYFKSIKFINSNSNGWKSFTPTYGGYEISVPSNYLYEKLVSVNYQIDKLSATEGSNSYLFNRSILNDYDYIEEDTFELNQLGRKFYEPLDYKLKSTQFGTYNTYPCIDISTKHKSNGSNLFVKIVIKDAQYFLMACKTNESNPPTNYFSSLKFKDFIYNSFQTYEDTLMHFSVKTDYKEEKLSSIEKLISEYAYFGKKAKSTNQYLSVREEKLFESPTTSENVKVEYYKSNDYVKYKSMDDIWKVQLDYYKLYSTLKITKKEIYERNKIPTMDFTLIDTNSIRSIRIRIMHKPGVLYVLSTMGDTLSKPSLWVTNFFDTFEPKDTVLAKSSFSDKLPDFFIDCASTDSTTKEKVKALYYEVKFEDKDADALMEFVASKNFNNVNADIKSSLIYSLGNLKSPKIIPFLKKEYPKYIDSTSLQLDILNALVSQKTKEGNLTFIQLLSVETPLTDDEYLIQRVFGPFYDSLEIAKVVYPALFEMTKYPEYKKNIYNLLSSLLDSALITPQSYVEQKKDILRYANEELKRQMASEENVANASSEGSNYNYNNAEVKAAEAAAKAAMDELFRQAASGATSDYTRSFEMNWSLLNYYNLLAPFYNEPTVRASFDKAFKSKNPEFKIELYAILLQNNVSVADTTINSFAKDPKTRTKLYSTLKRIKKQNRINPEFTSQNSLSYAYLFGADEDSDKADSIEFIGTKYVESKIEKGYIYFYKSQNKETGQKYLDYIGYQPKDSTKVEENYSVYSRREEINPEKTIEEQIKEICYNLSLVGRKRMTFKNDYYDNLYGEY